MLEWLEPLKQEPLQDYAVRMLESIGPIKGPLVLIGHSFGGVMAQEVARLRPVSKVILVSSVQSRQEIPWRYRITDPLGIPHLFLKEPAIATLPIWGPPFGYKGEEMTLFREMVNQQSNHLLQWSLRKFSRWQGVGPRNYPLVHIHGDNDKTLHYHLIGKVDYRIQKGSHMMVYKPQ